METLVNLTFDKELVQSLAKQKLDLDELYVYLVNGKITMQEYLYLVGIQQS